MAEPAPAPEAILYTDELDAAGECLRALLGKEDDEMAVVTPEEMERAFRICSGAMAMLIKATGQDPAKAGEFVSRIAAGITVRRRGELGNQAIAKA